MDKETFKKEIGFKIKVERMRKKISQEKLAEMADCSLSYIGFVERGEMSLSLYNFIKIASVLGLSIDEFLKESSSDVFCHPAVKRLYLYDCANGTEYMKTLEAYFLSMGNRARTAEELHIHRNSLAYRIDKMCELVPLDELSKNDLLHCLISCRLLRYLSKNDCLNVRQ